MLKFVDTCRNVFSMQQLRQNSTSSLMSMVGKRVLYRSSTGIEMVQVVCTERLDQYCQLATSRSACNLFIGLSSVVCPI